MDSEKVVVERNGERFNCVVVEGTARMKTSLTMRWLVLMVFCLMTVRGYCASDFTSDVTSAPYPWTHTRFLETGDNFHFAIVADRTCGFRSGVFEEAVAKLNLLRPSLVMSVGDFIEGYTDNTLKLQSQWTEFDGIIKELKSPFFYVAGNHDYGVFDEPQAARDAREQFWQRLRGPSYYYFIYKNTLFLCMNAMGGQNHKWGLGDKQLAWAKEVLKKHQEVRWTFCFMHSPLWADNVVGENVEYPRLVFELEKALKGRNYTVFAGHVHQYARYDRQGMKYFTLATTGGESELRGVGFGEFDHIMYVSMTDTGPNYLNLTLNGMLPDDIFTDGSLKFGKSIRFIPEKKDKKANGVDFTFTFKNTFDVPMTVTGRWEKDTLWSIRPQTISGIIPPNEVYSQSFHVELNRDNWAPLPGLVCRFNAGAFKLERDITPTPDCFDLLWSELSRITVYRADHAPTIDGKLNDALWRRAATVNNFMYPDFSDSAVPGTQVWLAYDDNNLYMAWRCEEKDMKGLVTTVKDRDGNVWTDDCFEFFLDTNFDRKTYYQFVVNSLGTVYDGKMLGKKQFNADVQVATSREAWGWTVELAIPWSDLDIQPPVAGMKMGYELSRRRPRQDSDGSVFQFPPLGSDRNHQPEYFGIMTFDR
jgi:3',5'-cyclic AMP phosphodiesterase CpdA